MKSDQKVNGSQGMSGQVGVFVGPMVVESTAGSMLYERFLVIDV